jgi:tripeptide aminopeptidase
MTLTERFLNYTSFNTQSDETSETTPSTPGQRRLAEEIVKELQEIGLEDITLDANGYVMATLAANASKEIPTIGFIAHLDTSPDMTGENVKARVLQYKGGNVVLSNETGRVLSPTLFPELNDYVGQEIIVADGSTLLGADDKAGIAAIVSAMQYLMEHPTIKHGKVRIAFTPDEEIGRGVDHFDVQKFGCQWAYTVDGGPLGELEYENFNAAVAKVHFKGQNIHPGMAKGKMVNALVLASEFISLLPRKQLPEHTEGLEGFYHPTDLKATVEEASLSLLVREYERIKFNQSKRHLQRLVVKMNKFYPESTTLHIRDQYYNMRDVVMSEKHILRTASRAMKAIGITPLIHPIRGGTDGARLSYMGLPCPNLFTGGHNFHGRYEFLPVQSLEKSMHTIIKIIELL